MRLLRKIIITIMCLQLIACQVVNDKDVQKSVSPVLSEWQGNNILADQVRAYKDLSKDLKNLGNDDPYVNNLLKGKYDNRSLELRYADAQERIRAWHLAFENKTLEMHQLIHSLGKSSYAVDNTGKQIKSEAEMAKSELLVAYNLFYLHRVYMGVSSRLFKYMVRTMRENYEQIPSYEVDVKKIMQKFLGTIGMVKVVQNDITLTLKKLEEMKTSGLLSEIEIKSIDMLIGGNEKIFANKETKSLDEAIEEQFEGDEKEQLIKLKKDFEAAFKGKSLLYGPNNPDHPLVHLLVITSNLTWGLVNSLVGLGFIAAGLILAPATRIINTISRMLTGYRIVYNVHWPAIKVAQNRMQLYVDSCGLGYIRSKMSMGLFELDFCTNHRFASMHEGGHAKQSALLGPLYLPAAILSYALVLGHGGFIEHWADVWAVRRTW